MAKKDRLEYKKSHWKGSKIYRFSCFVTRNFLCRSTMVADIFEDLEPPSKKFLATPLSFLTLSGKKATHRQSNTASAKNLFSSMDDIEVYCGCYTTCFDEYFLFHFITGRRFFLTAMLLLSWNMCFKRSLYFTLFPQ